VQQPLMQPPRSAQGTSPVRNADCPREHHGQPPLDQSSAVAPGPARCLVGLEWSGDRAGEALTRTLLPIPQARGQTAWPRDLSPPPPPGRGGPRAPGRAAAAATSHRRTSHVRSLPRPTSAGLSRSLNVLRSQPRYQGPRFGDR
jgi:hypothetical protein